MVGFPSLFRLRQVAEAAVSSHDRSECFWDLFDGFKWLTRVESNPFRAIRASPKTKKAAIGNSYRKRRLALLNALTCCTESNDLYPHNPRHRCSLLPAAMQPKLALGNRTFVPTTALGAMQA